MSIKDRIIVKIKALLGRPVLRIEVVGELKGDTMTFTYFEYEWKDVGLPEPKKRFGLFGEKVFREKDIEKLVENHNDWTVIRSE